MSREELDVAELLAEALSHESPTSGFHQRVMDRLAAASTVVELARLIGIAPLGASTQPPREDEGKGRPADDDADPDDDEEEGPG